MRMATLLVALMLSFAGCHKAHDLTGGDNSPHSVYQAVACCQDIINGKMVYPSSVPDSHASFCNNIKQAFRSDSPYNGQYYIPMTVDCGNGHSYIGDEYY